MTAKAKTGPAPATTVGVCPDCPAAPLEPTTTSYGCEHGVWLFDPASTPEASATEDELRAAILNSLDEGTLRDLLAAKTAPPAAEAVSEELTPAQKAAATKAAKAADK